MKLLAALVVVGVLGQANPCAPSPCKVWTTTGSAANDVLIFDPTGDDDLRHYVVEAVDPADGTTIPLGTVDGACTNLSCNAADWCTIGIPADYVSWEICVHAVDWDNNVGPVTCELWDDVDRMMDTSNLEFRKDCWECVQWIVEGQHCQDNGFRRIDGIDCGFQTVCGAP